MKQFIFFTLRLLLLVAVFVADAGATQIIRVGISPSLASDQGLFARRFKAIAEGLSGRELRISLFADGAFGTDGDLLERLEDGSLAVVSVSTGHAVAAVEELGTLALPGLIETHEEAVKSTTGWLGRLWNEHCLKKGRFRILGWSYSGPRTVSGMGPLPESPDAIREMVVAATFAEWKLGTDVEDDRGASGRGVKIPLYRYYRMHPFVIGESSWKCLSPKLQGILVQAGQDAQLYAMLMQALRPEEGGAVAVRPLVGHDQLQGWVWPVFYGLIGGREPIARTLDAINWR